MNPTKKMMSKQSTTISAIFEHTAIICEAVEDVGFISSVKRVLLFFNNINSLLSNDTLEIKLASYLVKARPRMDLLEGLHGEISLITCQSYWPSHALMTTK